MTYLNQNIHKTLKVISMQVAISLIKAIRQMNILPFPVVLVW